MVGEAWSSLALPPDPASVARVRRAAREALAGWEASAYEWVLSQLLTEVATNVVLHAGTPFDVRVQARAGGGLRVEVSDGDPRLPRRRRHSLEATTGRGLALLTQLSSRWGVERRPDGRGKTVWFELDTPDEDAGLTDLPDVLQVDLGADLAALLDPGPPATRPSPHPATRPDTRPAARPPAGRPSCRGRAPVRA